jgi:hypothetical protein
MRQINQHRGQKRCDRAGRDMRAVHFFVSQKSFQTRHRTAAGYWSLEQNMNIVNPDIPAIAKQRQSGGEDRDNAADRD